MPATPDELHPSTRAGYQALLDAGEYDKAIDYARALADPPDRPGFYDQLKASAFTDAGLGAAKRSTVEEGAAMWRALLEKRPTPAWRVNLASALSGVYWCAVKDGGWVKAWNDDQAVIQNSRAEDLAVAEDTAAPKKDRLRALVNAGNSYDEFARFVEAIELYDRALDLDPGFGMAHGNKAMALVRLAPYVRDHQPAVMRVALQHFQAALGGTGSVLEQAGPRTLATFQKQHDYVASKLETTSEELHSAAPIDDPFGKWCLRHDLLLHPSPECLSADSAEWDPLFFRGINVSTKGFEPPTQFTTFNLIKVDYISARWLAWLATERTAHMDELVEMSARARFVDTLDYARYDMFVGLALQAFQTANNLLDKLAGLLMLHLQLPLDPRNLYFKRWWGKKGVIQHHELADLLDAPNLGLWALVDLSGDFDKGGRYEALQDLRNAATHRFVAAHLEGVRTAANPLIERARWSDLKRHVIRQLQLARAAMFYLARAIETGNAKAAQPGDFRPQIPLPNTLPPPPP